MTYEEILVVLKEKIEIDNFAYEEYNREELGLGEIKEVDQYGGVGQGDTWYSVKHFVDHNVYIKVSGFYSSYEGVTLDGWDDCLNVIPKEKLITVYE